MVHAGVTQQRKREKKRRRKKDYILRWTRPMRLVMVGGRQASGRNQQRSDSHRLPSYPPSSVLVRLVHVTPVGVAA
ncbi:hypothetical protein CCHL11_01862 [Colletotrichum chlorophyti]|uniref:Uncharacterized protein n=1 Tax=Colletotrichum chlorophyti TaxID=708187 RepID=A0A1Q8RVM6_9PEZI|nr:hypothetical protein CCHL11_01862 [Colletotrichum chlorophyti]